MIMRARFARLCCSCELSASATAYIIPAADRTAGSSPSHAESSHPAMASRCCGSKFPWTRTICSNSAR